MQTSFSNRELTAKTPRRREKTKIKSPRLGVFAIQTNLCRTIVLFCLVIFSAQFAVAGEWRKQSAGTLAWLRAIYFLDAQRGWIAGSNGTLLATTDGGASWKIAQKFSEDNFRDVFFFDRENGWLLAERDVLRLKTPTEARSVLLRTTDGGATWQQTAILPIDKTINPQFTRLLFSGDGKIVWAVGEAGSLYSLEAGEIWRKQASPTRFLLRGGTIFNERESVLIGAGATILETPDGGKIWRAAKIYEAENARFNSIFFATRALGWTVGTGGIIFASTDGGKIWRAQKSPVAADLFDVRFVTPNEGWAAGDAGVLLRTTDSGNNWTIEKTNTTHRLERIFFIGREKGFAVGFGGTILSYSNQAQTRPRLRSATSSLKKN